MMKEAAINKMISSMYTEGILSEENEERTRVYLDWMYQAGWDERGNNLVAHNKKPVIQYDTQGNILGTYPSIKEASKISGSTSDVIYESIRFKRPSEKRHVWKYASNEQNKDNS
jgi:hypothetical protein